MDDTILSGGVNYRSVWLRCKVSPSFKPDELYVRVEAEGTTETPSFFVDPQLVRGATPVQGREVEGEVAVILIESHDGTLVVEVPGESVSYGPKIIVPRSLVSS
ncbi:MAG: hypothetical protein M3179_09750 [Actinomycetota bacterium]|nr:hypothetical protein [Actinomycetota bacterium]